MSDVECCWLVARSGEPLHAVVSCALPLRHALLTAGATKPRTSDFLRLLTHVLTKWRNETETGKAAWHDSSADFNIGDLSRYCGDPDLQRLMRASGIHRFHVEIVHDGFDAEWVYDKVLMDDEEERR